MSASKHYDSPGKKRIKERKAREDKEGDSSGTIGTRIRNRSNQCMWCISARAWSNSAKETNWAENKINLTQAYSLYVEGVGNETNGGELLGFVWRAMEYQCVFEPVYVFMSPNKDNAILDVGAHAKRLCKTPCMVNNATLHCEMDCYPDPPILSRSFN